MATWGELAPTNMAAGVNNVMTGEGFPMEPGGKDIVIGGVGGAKFGDDTRRQLSYADRLKTNVKYDERLKRNVLEIEIEKVDRENDVVFDQHCVARLLTSIGMDIKTHLKGYQVVYGKTITISVWCAAGVNLDRFCRSEDIQVTRGVWTKNIRPAGRRDIMVTVAGLDFNTPDSLVQDYITKFGGKVLSQDVIYSKYGEGPLKGIFNGERKYQVEFAEGAKHMGTYHFLDGAKVRVFYRGNIKTCGRCHKESRNCAGGGFAKDCQASGGVRIDLADHMKELWAEIDFSPTTFKLPAMVENEEGSDHNDATKEEGDRKIREDASFRRQIDRPQLTEDDIKKITGLKIRNLPLELSDELVLDFFKETVDKDIKIESLKIVRTERNIQASVVSGLGGEKVVDAVNKIDFEKTGRKILDRKLYCNILKDLTPAKKDQPIPPTGQPVAFQDDTKVDEVNPSPIMSSIEIVEKGTEAKPAGSVKEKTKALEKKVEFKEEKKKKTNWLPVQESGITKTPTHKRTHGDVGSPTSPEHEKKKNKPKNHNK